MSFDYAFISDRGKPTESGEDVEEEDHEEQVMDHEVMEILVGRDARSRMCSAIPVPQKGLDPTEWSVREGLRFLNFLGYTLFVEILEFYFIVEFQNLLKSGGRTCNIELWEIKQRIG